jgi:hypothetical protein
VWAEMLVESSARKRKRDEVLYDFEVFTAVIMKNAVFWDVTPCGCRKTDVSEEYIASIT